MSPSLCQNNIHDLYPIVVDYLSHALVQLTKPTLKPLDGVYPVIQDLLTRLQLRLAPFRWLLNNATGVSIPVAKTIYMAYFRSVDDYLSPALVQQTKPTLEPLEKFQNSS